MSINVEAKNMPNIIQFCLYLTKLLQKQNSSTFFSAKPCTGSVLLLQSRYMVSGIFRIWQRGAMASAQSASP